MSKGQGLDLRISEPAGISGSVPAVEGKEQAAGNVFPEPELNPPSPVLGFGVEAPIMQPAGESPAAAVRHPITEAQMTAVELGHNSTPDRCASVPFAPADRQVCPTNDGGIIQLFEGGVGAPPDEWRITEANRRQQILETYFEMIKPADEGGRGLTQADAVKEIGIGYATMFRWVREFKKDGYIGLLPKTDKCGRKTTFEKLGMSPDQVEQVRNEVQGINLDTESVTSALRLFANSDRCPAALARVILDPTRSSKHALPPSVRELARVTEPVRNAHRGPRRLSLKGNYTPRKMDVLPGDVFSADDTTPIWAWWVPWIESEEYPFGVKLLQGQFIPVIDVASQCVITFVLIAREQSSYRASDIWHLFGHTFDYVGLPRLGWQLERGSWEANIIRGQEVEYRENEVTYSRRVGGLRQLPTNWTDWHQAKHGEVYSRTLQTFTSFLPKSKSVESAINRSQTFEGTLWGCLGRDQMRKPFEKTKKLFQQCSRERAKVDPRQYFLSGEEIARRITGLVQYMNSEPMEGEVFKGVPKLNFDAAVSERPLFNFTGQLDELRWLYKRDWATGPKENPLRITSGWARVRLTDPLSGDRYSLFYANPEVFARHEGEQIVVYYDRENFEQPAQIILARTGEYLCEAPYFERTGTFLSGDLSGHDIRKRWRSAVMSIYGTLVQHAPSRQLPVEIAQRREEAKAQSPTSNVQGPRPNVVDGRPAAEDVQPIGSRAAAAPTAQDNLRRAAMSALRNLE